ncbi:MAG: helix-turn-helix domain-containing protein [Oscillospiraceae bacterium]|nr:helix-turn-helix domain-containing protein [Oscillospiraceae bacterium]
MKTQTVGALLRRLRQEQGLTQRELAERLCVSDKTISKWERDAGLPDIQLLPRLCQLLQVDSSSLLAGTLGENASISGTMARPSFFCCPVCGSITSSNGNISLSCCGRPLSALPMRKAKGVDRLQVNVSELDWLITSHHPMEKQNYVSFLAVADSGTLSIYKQYPEWEVQLRIPRQRGGTLFYYSTTKGLFYQPLIPSEECT